MSNCQNYFTPFATRGKCHAIHASSGAPEHKQPDQMGVFWAGVLEHRPRGQKS